MEIRTTEEARENVTNFAKRLINLMLDKKVIDADIKALKNEFKEEGVPIAVVNKAINAMKANKKRTDSEIFEQEVIENWLAEDSEIDNSVGALVAKD